MRVFLKETGIFRSSAHKPVQGLRMESGAGGGADPAPMTPLFCFCFFDGEGCQKSLSPPHTGQLREVVAFCCYQTVPSGNSSEKGYFP